MVYFQWALRLVVVVILYHYQQKCIHYKWRTLTVYVITTKLSSTPPPTFFLSSDFSSSGVLSFILSSTVSSVFSSSGHAVVCSFFNCIIRHYLLSPTTTSDWAALDKGKHDPDVSFAHLAAANLYYGEFGELLEGPLPLPQVSNGTGHSFVSSHYRRYGQLMEGPPPVTTRKDVEESVDVNDDDDDGGGSQDGDEGDVKDGDKADGQDGDGEDGQDDDGGDGQDGDREDNQDGNGGDTLDVDPMQSGEAEKGKSTSPIIGCMVEAEKGVGHTTSALPVDVTSVNILEDVLANPFDAFDTDHTISIVPDTPTVSAVGTTLAKPYINPDTLFEEWSLCTSCSLNVVSAELWRKQICNCHDKGFLDGMYMLGCVKHMSFNICDRHLHLLTLNLHLVDASPAELRSRMDLI